MIFNRTSRYFCTQISTQKTSTRWILCCLNKYKAIFNIRKLLFPRRCWPNCWTDFTVNMAKNGLLLTEISIKQRYLSIYSSKNKWARLPHSLWKKKKMYFNTGKYVPFLLFPRNMSFDSVHSLISLTSPRGRLSKQRLAPDICYDEWSHEIFVKLPGEFEISFFFHYFSSILSISKPGFRTRSWTEISLVSKNKMLHKHKCKLD